MTSNHEISINMRNMQKRKNATNSKRNIDKSFDMDDYIGMDEGVLENNRKDSKSSAFDIAIKDL